MQAEMPATITKFAGPAVSVKPRGDPYFLSHAARAESQQRGLQNVFARWSPNSRDVQDLYVHHRRSE